MLPGSVTHETGLRGGACARLRLRQRRFHEAIFCAADTRRTDRIPRGRDRSGVVPSGARRRHPEQCRRRDRSTRIRRRDRRCWPAPHWPSVFGIDPVACLECRRRHLVAGCRAARACNVPRLGEGHHAHRIRSRCCTGCSSSRFRYAPRPVRTRDLGGRNRPRGPCDYARVASHVAPPRSGSARDGRVARRGQPGVARGRKPPARPRRGGLGHGAFPDCRPRSRSVRTALHSGSSLSVRRFRECRAEPCPYRVGSMAAGRRHAGAFRSAV